LFVPKYSSRYDYFDRKFSFEHSSYLYGRGMGSEQIFVSDYSVFIDFITDPKSVPYITSWMVCRNIELIKVEFFGFYLRAVFYFEPKRNKYFF
jgi:hypothetical protein